MKSLLLKILVKIEKLGEAFFRFLIRIEPSWVKRHPARFWIPIIAGIVFVVVDNFMPSDPRIRFTLTRFEVDADLSLLSVWHSAQKLKHIVFFFLMYIQLKQIWRKSEDKIGLFLLMFAIFIELEQAFIAGREARPADLAPNVIGYALARIYLSQRERRQKTIYYSELD